jgi:hypothetical protein
VQRGRLVDEYADATRAFWPRTRCPLPSPNKECHSGNWRELRTALREGERVPTKLVSKTKTHQSNHNHAERGIEMIAYGSNSHFVDREPDCSREMSQKRKARTVSGNNVRHRVRCKKPVSPSQCTLHLSCSQELTDVARAAPLGRIDCNNIFMSSPPILAWTLYQALRRACQSHVIKGCLHRAKAVI